jgi:hypothetical protein
MNHSDDYLSRSIHTKMRGLHTPIQYIMELQIIDNPQKL